MFDECDVVNADRRRRSHSWHLMTLRQVLGTHSSSRTSCTVVHCLSWRSAAARSCVRRWQLHQEEVDVNDAKCRSLKINSYWLAALLPTWLTIRRKTHELHLHCGPYKKWSLSVNSPELRIHTSIFPQIIIYFSQFFCILALGSGVPPVSQYRLGSGLGLVLVLILCFELTNKCDRVHNTSTPAPYRVT